MMEPSQNTPKSRANLRDVLISSFESQSGLPSEQQARQARRRRRLPITSVRFGGAESFFVGVFAGVAGGVAAGYFGMVFAEIARKSVHDSITMLFPDPVAPAAYVFGSFFGAIVGIYLGCTMLAPQLERRRYSGTRFEGRKGL